MIDMSRPYPMTGDALDMASAAARGVARRLRRLARPARLGGFRSTSPVGTCWGLDRGTPIDRYYIDLFLASRATDIRGRCLEVRDTGYVDRYGSGVSGRDILDIDPTNARATFVADLAAADSVPSDTFDCFVLTQTLQFVDDPRAALRHVHRILAPGGVLLLTVPVISRVGPGERDQDRWRFTEVGCRSLLGPLFGPRLSIRSYGNVLSAVAFLEGMAAEELRRDELDVQDEAYPVIVSARAIKPVMGSGDTTIGS